MRLVYRYRVKSLLGLLNQQARTVNFVWNYCNDRQKDTLRFHRPWHTGFDLIKLTTGCSKELGLHSGTVNEVCQQYARSRQQSHRPYLRYRGRKALGWVRQFDHVVAGNVNAAALAKTSMAKSVLDAGWSTLRTQLAYKAVRHGARYTEVDERFTTQIGSNCGAKPDSRPRGIADLGIREWQCSDCGAVHDRDLNAAINILRRGRATLAAAIPAL